MNTYQPDIATDLCYRCGYDLRATPDDSPCPECGLLAARSRRPSDELRYTRPRWLLALAWGSTLAVLSILGGIAWGLWVTRRNQLSWLAYLRFYDMRTLLWGWLGAAVAFFVGVFLLTRREGYPPADRADRSRRITLRLAAGLPLLAGILGVMFTKVYIPHRVTGWVYSASQGMTGAVTRVPTSWITNDPIPALGWAAFLIATVGSAPLVVLLFLHLRGLAKRARSAHLAEHCIIVGIGAALALLYVAAYGVLRQNFHRHGLMQFDQSMRSPIIFNMTLGLGVMAGLFILWSIYLLVRFTISFIAAARDIRRTQGKPS